MEAVHELRWSTAPSHAASHGRLRQRSPRRALILESRRDGMAASADCMAVDVGGHARGKRHAETVATGPNR